MQSEKNLVEEALIQMKQIEDVLSESAKGILSSTMKEEINELVKESLNEQEDEDEMDIDMDSEDDMEMDIDSEDDMEMDIDSEDDMEMDMDDEDDMEMDMDDEDDMEMGMDDDVIDMRGASQSELLKVFKAMDGDDGIIISKDGSDISLTDDGDEYLIRLGEQISEFGDEDMEDDMEYDAQEYGMRYFNDADEEGDFVPFDDENEDIDMDYAMSKRLGLKYFNDNEDEEDDDMELDEEDEYMEGDYVEEDYDMELDEDDTQSTIDKIFENKDEIIYEIEMDEQEEFDMEDEEEFDMENEEEFDCANFSTASYLEKNPKATISDVYSYLQEMGCLGGGSTIGENYNYLGEGKKGPKFKYKMPTKGFDEKKKEGPKKVGTGKPKFQYNANAENTNGKMKIVTGKRKETKEASRTYTMGSKTGLSLIHI